MPPPAPSPRALTRRLVDGAPVPSDAPHAVAAHTACERFYDELMRWTGGNGCHALFHRAVSLTSAAHPQLARVEVRPNVQPHLAGIEEMRASAGPDATKAALESVLESVLEHLGRFIGDDLLATIVDRVVPHPDSLGGAVRNPEERR